MVTSKSKIIEKIDNYDYISFDLFDTLVFRNLLIPEDIFRIVGNKLSFDSEEFYRIRMRAQESANDKKTTEEFSLNQIYTYMYEFNDKEKELIKNCELETELMFTIRNSFFDEIIEFCKKSNKKIVITTDIYLPEVYLKKMLTKLNIQYDYIFSSCKYGKRKSRGTLFKVLLSELNISSKSIIHIGDNRRSDYLMPRTCGIKSILYVRDKKSLQVYSNNYIVNSIISGLIKNNANVNNYYEELGFNVLGPLLTGFVQWIHNKYIESDVNKICFLARDSYIIHRLYEALFPNDEIEYIYVSRRSLTIPCLVNSKSMDDLLLMVPFIGRTETPESFLKKLGIYNQKVVRQIEEIAGDVIYRNDLKQEQGKIIYDIIKEYIIVNSRSEMITCMNYLIEKFDKESVFIVDLGWYGTIQKSLERLFSMNSIPVELHGLYLGKLLRDNEQSDTINASSYAFNEMDIESRNLFAYSGLIEIFFSAPHGTTRNYIPFQEKSIPKLEEFDDSTYDSIRKIQESALNFALNNMELFEYANLQIKGEEIFNTVKKFFCSPSLKNIKDVGSLTYYEGENNKIICYSGLRKYLSSPKNIISDYECSYWKTGFLKKILPIFNAKNVYEFIEVVKKVKRGKYD